MHLVSKARALVDLDVEFEALVSDLVAIAMMVVILAWRMLDHKRRLRMRLMIVDV